MKKNLLYFCILGCIYLLLEFFMRAVSFDIHNYSNSFKYLSLMGISSIWMFFVGGIAGILLGIVFVLVIAGLVSGKAIAGAVGGLQNLAGLFG